MERIQIPTKMKRVTHLKWGTRENDKVHIKWNATPHDVLLLKDRANNERYGVE